jgi:hypothetical protein
MNSNIKPLVLNGLNIKYVEKKPQQTPIVPTTNNVAAAKTLIKSEYERYGTNLVNDYQSILNGGCYYLPNFITTLDDLTLFNQIKNELKNNNKINWSKHQKFENPTFSKTFLELVKLVSTHFKITPLETRLNYYRNGLDWKPYHHDSHAYQDRVREDFTIGISLGFSRELSFVHEETGNKFNFPQNNGDVFAFNKEINSKFMHGIPKISGIPPPNSDRISIIVWGKKID